MRSEGEDEQGADGSERRAEPGGELSISIHGVLRFQGLDGGNWGREAGFSGLAEAQARTEGAGHGRAGCEGESDSRAENRTGCGETGASARAVMSDSCLCVSRR